jgi:hypothetical protein
MDEREIAVGAAIRPRGLPQQYRTIIQLLVSLCTITDLFFAGFAATGKAASPTMSPTLQECRVRLP